MPESSNAAHHDFANPHGDNLFSAHCERPGGTSEVLDSRRGLALGGRFLHVLSGDGRLLEPRGAEVLCQATQGASGCGLQNKTEVQARAVRNRCPEWHIREVREAVCARQVVLRLHGSQRWAQGLTRAAARGCAQSFEAHRQLTAYPPQASVNDDVQRLAKVSVTMSSCVSSWTGPTLLSAAGFGLTRGISRRSL